MVVCGLMPRASIRRSSHCAVPRSVVQPCLIYSDHHRSVGFHWTISGTLCGCTRAYRSEDHRSTLASYCTWDCKTPTHRRSRIRTAGYTLSNYTLKPLRCGCDIITSSSLSLALAFTPSPYLLDILLRSTAQHATPIETPSAAQARANHKQLEKYNNVCGRRFNAL